MGANLVSDPTRLKLEKLIRDSRGTSLPLADKDKRDLRLRVTSSTVTSYGYPAIRIVWDNANEEYVDLDAVTVYVKSPDEKILRSGDKVRAVFLGVHPGGGGQLLYDTQDGPADDIEYIQIDGESGDYYTGHILGRHGAPSGWTLGQDVRVYAINGERLFVGRKYRSVKAIGFEYDSLPVYVTSIECCDDAVCQDLPFKACGRITWDDEFLCYCYGAATFGRCDSSCPETFGGTPSVAKWVDLSTSFTMGKQATGELFGYLIPLVNECCEQEPPRNSLEHTDGTDLATAFAKVPVQFRLKVECTPGNPGYYRLTLSDTASGTVGDTGLVWGTSSGGSTTLDVAWDDLPGPHVGSAWDYTGTPLLVGNFSIEITLGETCNEVPNGMLGAGEYTDGEILIGNGKGPIESSDAASVLDGRFRVKLNSTQWMTFGVS